MATRPAPEPTVAAPRRKWPFAVAGLAVLLLAGGLAYVFVLGGPSVHAAARPPPVKPVFIPVEPLTVNLLADGRPRFLHLGISLRTEDEAARERVAEAMPELRSRLLLMLSNRDPASLATPADKMRLAEEIRRELDRPIGAGLPPQGIRGIGFSAFVVQ